MKLKGAIKLVQKWILWNWNVKKELRFSQLRHLLIGKIINLTSSIHQVSFFIINRIFKLKILFYHANFSLYFIIKDTSVDLLDIYYIFVHLFIFFILTS